MAETPPSYPPRGAFRPGPIDIGGVRRFTGSRFIRLDIRPSAVQIQQAQILFAKAAGGARQVLAQDLNRVAEQVRTAIRRRLQAISNVKTTEVTGRISIKRATEKSLAVLIRIRYAKLPADAFKGTRATKRGGVRVPVMKNRPPVEIASGFAGKDVSGNKRFWVGMSKLSKRPTRQGKYAGRTIKVGSRRGELLTREPIRFIWGMSVTQILDEYPGALDGLQKEADQLLRKRLATSFRTRNLAV